MKVERADKDPEIRKVMPELAEQRRQMNANAEQRQSLNADQDPSITARADLFASAPDLKAHHQQAVAAAEPLELSHVDKPAHLPQIKPVPGVAGLEI